MKKVEKLFSIRNMEILAGCLMGLSLVPLLLLGKYNVMCYDDYFFGATVHKAWVDTGSIKEAVDAAVNHANTNYMNWQGCWLVSFLTAMYPANFDYRMSWIVPVVSICLFTGAIYLLGRQLLTKWFGGGKTETNLVLFVLIFMFFQVMDAPFEGIYWYNGVIAYIVPQAFVFFTVALMIKNLFSDKVTALGIGIASVCSVVSVGGNYVTTLQAEILLVLLLAYAIFLKRNRLKATLIPFLTGTIFFCVNVFAPGNAARTLASGVKGYNPFVSVILSFYNAILYIIEWTPTIVVFTFIALIPILWIIVRKSNRKFQYPALISLGLFCVFSAMYTPTLYAMGTAGLNRANNIIQIVYYLCLLGGMTYWIGWLQQKKSQLIKDVDEFMLKRGKTFTAVAMLVVLIIWAGTMDKNTYNSISALRSIVNDEGKVFYEESLERYELYQDDSIKEVIVKPYSQKPALFDFYDLSTDRSNWINQGAAAYWNKEYIAMESNPLQ